MSNSNEYMVSFKCGKRQNLFNVANKLAPFLKILAFILVFPAIFFPYIFIAAAIIFVISVIINYYKWHLVYNYNYTINKGYLQIKKNYRYIKPKIMANILLEDIAAKIMFEHDIDNMKNVLKCYCEQSHFKVFILVTHIDNHFALVADNYFYSLLSKEKK